MHRPIAQATLTPAVQIGLKTDDYPAKLPANHTPLADQTEVWNALKTDDHPAKLSANPAANHTPLADQPKAWSGLKTDDHPAKLFTKPDATHSPLADQTDGTEQQPTLACMKEALAQFKSMEDLTRPPPNPVLALSKQKVAIATHMKQYHDIIHVSYTIQTV